MERPLYKELKTPSIRKINPSPSKPIFTILRPFNVYHHAYLRYYRHRNCCHGCCKPHDFPWYVCVHPQRQGILLIALYGQVSTMNQRLQ